MIVQCPTCKKPVEWSEKNPWRPFCSERCKLIDLGAWANDEYLIEGEPGSAMSLSEQDLDNAAQAALRRAEHIAEAEAKRSKRRR